MASVYWIRSFVPTLKKLTSGASRSAIMAAEGISIMTPISTCSLNGDAFCPQFRLHLIQDLLGLVQFRQSRDHGVEDLDVPVDGRPQDAAQLRPKQIAFLKTIPDGPEAQRRVRFLFEAARQSDLVPAHVQRPDHDLVGVGLLCDMAVCLVMLLLGRQRRPGS